jgi:hypothetical protein
VLESSALPTCTQIANVKSGLIRSYFANQIYLVYHREIEIAEAKALFARWRDCGPWVPLVPALVLQDYDLSSIPQQQCNFSDAEIVDLVNWFKSSINPNGIAVLDVWAPTSSPSGTLAYARRTFCNGQANLMRNTLKADNTAQPTWLIRLGLQPDERIDLPLSCGIGCSYYFDAAVMDTYSGIASGKTHALWENWCGDLSTTPGQYSTSAKQNLTTWIDAKVSQRSVVTYDLVVVGMNYNADQCGRDTGGPGDDPVPVASTNAAPDEGGRNWHAYSDVMWARLRPDGPSFNYWGGISLDLQILQVHSRMSDGDAVPLYEQLKSNSQYVGKYSSALNEAAGIFYRAPN